MPKCGPETGDLIIVSIYSLIDGKLIGDYQTSRPGLPRGSGYPWMPGGHYNLKTNAQSMAEEAVTALMKSIELNSFSKSDKYSN